MIKMVRVDERLVHGQVAVSWSKVLGITHLVVINDRVAKNEMQKMTLKMAVPENIKFLVKGVEEGIALLNDPRIENFTLMVVIENFTDAFEIVKRVPGIEILNVGNYGLLPVNQRGNEQKEIASAVRVDAEDLSIIKMIAELNIPFEAQLTPDAPKKNMKKIMKGA